MKDFMKNGLLATFTIAFCVQAVVIYLFDWGADTAIVYGWLTIAVGTVGIPVAHVFLRRYQRKLDRREDA